MNNISTSDISIVTVTYNSMRFLNQYFKSIIDQNVKCKEVIIIDSGSTDKTLTSVRKIKDKQKGKLTINILESINNIGYTGGNNLGAKNAKGDYLFFLGPDSKIDKNCLSSLVKKAKLFKGKDFILICRQKRYDTGEFLFDGICTDIFQFPFRLFNADSPKTSKPPFYCDGTAIFISQSTFNTLGQFDENLFLFCEDIDLSWKAHLMKIPLINVPEAIVYHYSGGSLSGGIVKAGEYTTTYMRRYLGERNTITNFLKNYSVFSLVFILPIYFFINLFEMFVFILFGRSKVAYQYLAAWWWNIKKFKPILQKRRWIQKRRKIGDWEILKKLYFGSGKFNAFIKIKIPTFENV